MKKYSLEEKRRVEATLRNLPFYCFIRTKYGKGMVFAMYRVVSDLEGRPRLMRIAELGSTIYSTRVQSLIAKRLKGRIIIGKPRWYILCSMSDSDLNALASINDNEIAMAIAIAKEVLWK